MLPNLTIDRYEPSTHIVHTPHTSQLSHVYLFTRKIKTNTVCRVGRWVQETALGTTINTKV